jgi:hypothetical protein
VCGGVVTFWVAGPFVTVLWFWFKLLFGAEGIFPYVFLLKKNVTVTLVILIFMDL